MAAKECPMCGELMNIKKTTSVVRVPGTSETKTTIVNEWQCPECDYFEDADDDIASGQRGGGADS